MEVLSTLDLEATPPFEYAHDHFGYRDRLSQPVIEGTGEVPTPGTGAPLKPANSSSGILTKAGRQPTCRNQKFCPAMAATWLIAAEQLHGFRLPRRTANCSVQHSQSRSSAPRFRSSEMVAPTAVSINNIGWSRSHDRFVAIKQHSFNNQLA